MKSLYDIVMDLCRVRDRIEPIATGEIRKGHCSGNDFSLEPGMRKTMLRDAREICKLQTEKLNASANLILEHEKLYREALESLERWVMVLRRGDMGGITTTVIYEILKTEDLIKRIRAGFPT